MKLSVVIPAHNPEIKYLEQVLHSLKEQSLPPSDWELLIVDNASTSPLESWLHLDWHPSARIIQEPRLGLTAARIAGFTQSSGDVVVLVDDDNVLASDYLEHVAWIARDFPFLGTWSGDVELVLERGSPVPPAGWGVYLTERRVNTVLWSNDPGHNDSTPWGAGMCIRRSVADSYCSESERNPAVLQLDLQGSNLIYGGDSDISYHGCFHGLGKGVFPQLKVRHLILPRRCDRAYLLKVAEGRAYSEWLHHWVNHKKLPLEPGRFLPRIKKSVRYLLNDADGRALEKAWTSDAHGLLENCQGNNESP